MLSLRDFWLLLRTKSPLAQEAFPLNFPSPLGGNNVGIGDALYFSSLRVIGFMLRIQHAKKITNVGGFIYRLLGGNNE